MDNNTQEDNIRVPDEIISEQLLQDTRSDFEKETDEAVYISIQEINQQRLSNLQFEEKLLKDYADETKRRKEIFKEFLFNLNKIGKFDKEIREIYNILDPIIESYCDQCIQTCELDGETYNKIFGILKKIRNDQHAFDSLKTIILREE